MESRVVVGLVAGASGEVEAGRVWRVLGLKISLLSAFMVFCFFLF